MVQVASHFKYFASKWNMCRWPLDQARGNSTCTHVRRVFYKNDACVKEGRIIHFTLKPLQHVYIHKNPIKTHIFRILELPSIIFYIMSDRSTTVFLRPKLKKYLTPNPKFTVTLCIFWYFSLNDKTAPQKHIDLKLPHTMEPTDF